MGWHRAPLTALTEIQGGIQKQPKRAPRSNRFPFLRVANVTATGLDLRDVHEIELFRDEPQRLRLLPGDLLVVEGNGSASQIGRAAVWDGSIPDCVHQNHLIRVRPGPNLLPRYLGLIWNSPAIRDELTAVSSSTSGLHTLSVSKLKRIELPYPPLDEQRRIVEVLEAHLSRIDAASNQITAAVKRVEGWRRGSLEVAVRAASTDYVPLRSLLQGIEAGRSFGGPARPAGPDEWGIIKVSAMTWGEFRPHENKAVPADRVDPRFEIRPGDILVSRANTTEYVGAPVLVDDTRPRLLLSDKSLRLAPRPGIAPRWLATVLATRSVRRQISRLATGTKDSMRNISQESLLSVVVPTARPDQQARLIEARAEIEQVAAATAARLATVSLRGTALRRALLAAAFSGRLTSQPLEPAEIVQEFTHV